MRDASAFDRAVFLGLARRARRDPYRLSLFARHLEPDEDGLAVLPIAGGTLVVTERRLIHFTSHLEVDGAWNVREFQGYTIEREIPLADVHGATAVMEPDRNEIAESLRVSTRSGGHTFLVSEGPERVLSDEDAALLVGFLRRRNPDLGPTA